MAYTVEEQKQIDLFFAEGKVTNCPTRYCSPSTAKIVSDPRLKLKIKKIYKDINDGDYEIPP